MTYEEKIKRLESTSDTIDVTYVGKKDEKWLYAKVACNGGDEISAADFPSGCVIGAQGVDHIDFMVALHGDFRDEADMISAMEYCDMYTGQ